MNLDDMLALSLNLEDEKPKEHNTIVRGARTILSGQDGVGKSTAGISVMALEYQNNTDLVCIYFDADDKSAKQVRHFAKFFKEHLNGQYLNLSLINKQLVDKDKRTMLEFLIEYSDKYFDDGRDYFILIDNLNHMTGEFENDNSRVTAVRIEMEQSFLKKPNVKTLLVAHAGKDDKGVRGATSMRAAFGEEIQIRKDIDLGIIAEVRKDSEGYHSTNLYKLDLINKETFEMEFKELSGHKLVEDKAAYQAKRLEDILLSIVSHIQSTYDMSTNVVADLPFTRAIYLLASPSQIHTDDKQYITPNFVAKGLSALYTKVGIEVMKHPDKGYKMFDINGIDVKKVASVNKKIAITDVVEELIKDKAIRQLDKSAGSKSMYNIKDLQADILNYLNTLGSMSGEQLRVAVYKSKEVNPTKYSKTYAKDNMPKAITVLEEEGLITVLSEGRKKTYSIK